MAEGGLGQKIGSAFIEVAASFVNFGDGLASDITNSLVAQTTVVGQALENLGQALFTKFTVPVALATAANITQFQALDREVSQVLTLFGTAPSIVDRTFGQMQDGIRDVAKEVGGLESEIADGLYQAISAGIPRDNVFDFLETANMAAMADKTADLTTSVDGLSTVINAFGFETEKATDIADVMFQTVALGKTTFGELSSDIGRVAPLAANAGVAFEELFTIIASLTLQGLSTSEAISFLRAAITGILRPTEELNAIFMELGFSSAEAAIPVLGLQGAFDAVFQAAGGSTSQLQELIGTSEGVSAALGVVGDNADTFERIFTGIQSSTGAATKAFEIMDGSVGRSFGRMTEAFDRLGNTFGEMGSQLVVPVVEVIADIVSNMADRFEALVPIAKNAGEVIGGFFSIFNIPVIREFVTVIAAMVSGLYGFLGVIGAVSLTLGKFIQAALSIKTVHAIWDKFGETIRGFPNMAAKLTGVFENLTTTLNSKATPAMGLLGKASQGLTNIFSALAISPAKMALALGAAGIAITGIIILFSELTDNINEAADAANLFGVQADILADALGLVNNGISLQKAEEGETNMNDLEESARGMVTTLQDAVTSMGELNALQLLDAVAVDLVWKGNSPEDAIDAIQDIGKLTGIEVDISAGDIDTVTEQLDIFGQSLRTNLSFAEVAENSAQLAGTAESIAAQLVTLFELGQTSGNFDPFLAGLTEVENRFGEFSEEAGQIRGALRAAFEEQGLDFGFWNKVFNQFEIDPDTILEQLRNAGALINEEGFEVPIDIKLPPVPDFISAPSPLGPDFIPPEEMERLKALAREAKLSVEDVQRIIRESGEEGITTYQNLVAGIDTAFDEAQAHVEGSMEGIQSALEAQMPVLDVYTGAVKQSFDEWKTGQDQFQEDVKAVTTLRDTLKDANLPQELIAAFDRAPIEKQAWLAGLGSEDLEVALQEMADSFKIVDENAKLRIEQDMEDIMVGAQAILDENYTEMHNAALIAGGTTATNWSKEFDTAASEWERMVQGYITTITGILGVTIPGPKVGAPTFGGGLSPDGTGAKNESNVYIYNPSTNDLAADLAKSRAIAETSLFG